jgi:hypothetical protein
MARALSDRGIDLATNAEQYRRGHHLPSWYLAMRDHTPLAVWTTSGDRDEFCDALQELPAGPAVLKDYSKSEKHYWHEAMYIPDVSDQAHALTVAERFVKLRGSAFDNGFVVRQFEQLSAPEAPHLRRERDRPWARDLEVANCWSVRELTNVIIPICEATRVHAEKVLPKCLQIGCGVTGA